MIVWYFEVLTLIFRPLIVGFRCNVHHTLSVNTESSLEVVFTINGIIKLKNIKYCFVKFKEEKVLYMAGGEWPDGNPNDTFWQFNSTLDEWKQLSSLQTPRSELGYKKNKKKFFLKASKF